MYNVRHAVAHYSSTYSNHCIVEVYINQYSCIFQHAWSIYAYYCRYPRLTYGRVRRVLHMSAFRSPLLSSGSCFLNLTAWVTLLTQTVPSRQEDFARVILWVWRYQRLCSLSNFYNVVKTLKEGGPRVAARGPKANSYGLTHTGLCIRNKLTETFAIN